MGSLRDALARAVEISLRYGREKRAASIVLAISRTATKDTIRGRGNRDVDILKEVRGG